MRRNGFHGKTNYPITRIAFDNMKVLVHHRVCQRAEQSAETLSLNEQPSIPSASHNPPLLEHLYIPLTCERARIGTLRLFMYFLEWYSEASLQILLGYLKAQAIFHASPSSQPITKLTNGPGQNVLYFQTTRMSTNILPRPYRMFL